jgi:hypothetical protein
MRNVCVQDHTFSRCRHGIAALVEGTAVLLGIHRHRPTDNGCEMIPACLSVGRWSTFGSRQGHRNAELVGLLASPSNK